MARLCLSMIYVEVVLQFSTLFWGILFSTCSSICSQIPAQRYARGRNSTLPVVGVRQAKAWAQRAEKPACFFLHHHPERSRRGFPAASWRRPLLHTPRRGLTRESSHGRVPIGRHGPEVRPFRGKHSPPDWWQAISAPSPAESRDFELGFLASGSRVSAHYALDRPNPWARKAK